MCIETIVLHQTHNSCHSDNCERNNRTNDCMSKVHKNEVLTSMKGWGGGKWKRRWESEVRMCLLYSNRKDSSWLTETCKRLLFFHFLWEEEKKTGRLTTVSKREEHKEFCGTIVKQEGDQMERCPAGGKEQHHGGHHSYRTLLPPENERHLYCYRHVNNSTIQVCQSNTISFVLVYQDHVIREQQCRRYADVMQYRQSKQLLNYTDKQKSFCCCCLLSKS